MTVGLLSFGTVSGFAGQSGNPVGHAATPALVPPAFSTANGQTWPGAYSSLTAWPGGTGAQTISSGANATSGAGTSGNPYVFAFYDFNSSASGLQISLSNCIFVGCRFQSNAVANYNVQTGSTNVAFIYCSFVPLASLYTAPPGLVWPSAGALLNTTTQVTDTNCIDGSSGYQVGLSITTGASNIVADHCNSWGFGNSFSQMSGTVSNLTYSNCWVHDPANASPQTYHIDGIGYVNGTTPPSNVTITRCVIAGIGNTNGIAFQSASSGYSGIAVTNCYLSGFGLLVDMCHNTSGNSNLTFTDNTIGTDVAWVFGPIYTDFTTQFTGGTNLWRRNTLKVLPGTAPVGGSTFSFSSADNGKYIFPGSTLSVSDFTG